MAKQVTVLGLGGEVLRGVRLDEAGTAYVRGTEEAWPLLAAPAPADGETAETPEAAVTEEVVAEDRPLARAFSDAAAKFGTREFVLSVPLSRLLVKTVRLPAEARDDLLGAAQLELDGISPFSDEVLRPGVEVFAETDTEIVAVVSALPTAPSEDISEALAAAKVRVTRTDATALGWLRGLWPRICETAGVARRLVLLNLDGAWDLVVLDADSPVFLRGIGAVSGTAELGREITLSLLQGGCGDADEVVVCVNEPLAPELAETLAAFGPVRPLLVDDDFAGVEGAARRTVEGAALDVTPEAWREALAETRFGRSMRVWLGAAVGLWLVLMGVFYGYSAVYNWRKEGVDKQLQQQPHRSALKKVKDLRKRVELVERYADKSRGALEQLRIVTDCLPQAEDMVLTKFQYHRGKSVRVDGTAGQREDIRAFTANLENVRYEGTDEKLFARVVQTGGETLTRKGTIRFTLEGFFPEQDDEDGTSRKGGGR